MKKSGYIFILLILAMSCKEKYVSPIESPVTGYLVIEGIINNGPGTSNVRLTRTTKLGNEIIVFEKKAQVSVESENNITYTLIEKTDGNYSADNLSLNSSQKYRLHIKTNSGQEFVSDFVEVKKNPPIDSISWKREDDGVQLYIHTHDDLNNTRYYQWDFTETWEFHSAYVSSLKYKYTPSTNPRDKNPIIEAVYRDPVTQSYDPTIVTCWQSSSSTNLELGSTIKLEKDIVYLPLTFIEPKSWKLSVLYTILVKQYALTKEGYEFLEKMKKNTEVTGSVFDPQPSELKGNIHNVANPNEPVIGFFSICNIEQKRIWISKNQVPGWGYSQDCYEVTIPNISDSIRGYGNTVMATVPKDYSRFGDILTFNAAPPECVDCTLRGTNVKPAFWP